ncbi:MAG: ParB/RepB/Spo0J family partition protein [Candidatus Dormibacteraeota bacterium]|nr:ParB/RepB/Spo0J family partition protein [Candidatus Dormibacteraeota bacterium]
MSPSPTRTRLGRGLQALIPTAPEGTADLESGFPQWIAIDQIRPSTEQSRRHFPAEPLRELAESIRRHGLLQPLLVRRVDGGFELIAGERRWRAAQEAGLTTVPAIVRGAVEDEDSLILGLIENLQREDLDPIEEARGIEGLVTRFGLTHEEVAARLGRTRVAITNALRLLSGTPALISATASSAISAGHARALIALPNADDQEYGLKIVLAKRLSVRQTERWVHDYLTARAARPRQQRADPLRETRDRLRARYGDSAQITGSGAQGRVTVRYETPEGLQDLLDRLLH